MAKQKYEVIGRGPMFDESTLATIKIDKNPTFLSETSFPDKKGKKVVIPKRLICIRNMPGGYLIVNVYNAKADDVGKTLPAKITFAKKLVKYQETGLLFSIYYANAEITKGAKTNLALAIRDTIDHLDLEAPCFKMTFSGKPPSFIGFAKRK